MKLNEFKTYKEGNRLEMKAAQGRDGTGAVPRSAWETLSAFANTSGGTIVLGVKEPEPGVFEVIGLGNPDKVLDDFWNAALSKGKVSARFLKDEDASIEEVDGKHIVVIRVPWVDRHSRPVYINDDLFGGTFRRTHTGDHLCGREEVLSMLRDADTSSVDGRVIDGARMDDLDYGTIERYRNAFRAERSGSEWNGYDDVDFLRAIGATGKGDDGQDHPTGAGLLMFGKDRWITDEFPHYFLDYRQEAGTSERWADRFTSQPGDWSGNVYDFYFRVYNKLKAALKVPFGLDADMRRIDDTPAHKALREAIANCLTNANYYERRGITCVWRDDAITIENPGDFRLPIEEARKPGTSDPRNEVMLKILSFVSIGERAGSGMGTIENGWIAGGYAAPRYEVAFGPDRTTLTLPLVSFDLMLSKTVEDRRSSVEVPSKTVEDDLTSRQRAVIEFLAAAGPSRTAEIAEGIGMGTSQTNVLLRSLIDLGLVDVSGATSARRYRLMR